MPEKSKGRIPVGTWRVRLARRRGELFAGLTALGFFLCCLLHAVSNLPVAGCLAVGIGVAAVVFLVVRYIVALPPGMPPWFRLKNEHEGREVHHVRLLLNQQPAVDNPPDPAPLPVGPVHGQPLNQLEPTPKLRLAVWLQPLGQGPDADIQKDVDTGANAPYDLVDVVVLAADTLWVYAQWREGEEVRWHAETV